MERKQRRDRSERERRPEGGPITEPAADAAAPPVMWQLRREWYVAVDQPLLLISQLPRAGGTLLGRLFDDHLECFAHPYELRWGRATKSKWPRVDLSADADTVFELLHEAWVTKFAARHAYSKNIGHHVHNERSRHPFLFDLPMERWLFRTLFDEKRPRSMREVFNLYFTAFFNAWLDYQNLYRQPKRFVSAFALRVNCNREALAGFWQDYPDGHLVSVIRDPASWYASVKALGGKAPWSASIDDSMRRWITSAEGTLAAHAERPDRVSVIIFEDLVQEPEPVMRRICDMTGLAFNESLLRPTYNGRPIASDSSFAARYGIDRSAANRRSSLSGAETDRIRELAGGLYEESCARSQARPLESR